MLIFGSKSKSLLVFYFALLGLYLVGMYTFSEGPWYLRLVQYQHTKEISEERGVIDTFVLPLAYFADDRIRRAIWLAALYASISFYKANREKDHRYEFCVPVENRYPSYMVFIKGLSNDTCVIDVVIDRYMGRLVSQGDSFERVIYYAGYKPEYISFDYGALGLILFEHGHERDSIGDVSGHCCEFLVARYPQRYQKSIPFLVKYYPTVFDARIDSSGLVGLVCSTGCFMMRIVVAGDFVYISDILYYPIDSSYYELHNIIYNDY